MMKVTFLAANEGTVEVTTSFGMKMVFANAKQLAEVADTLDFSDAYSSSSMDFASEYGFDTDSGAWEMVEAGLEAA